MCRLSIRRTTGLHSPLRLKTALGELRKPLTLTKKPNAFHITIATIAALVSGTLLLSPAILHADKVYSFGIEYGDVIDDIEVVQLLVTRDISEWFNQRIADAGSRGVDTELAMTILHWNHEENDLNGASIETRFIYDMHFLKIGRLTPHIEYALGTALISDTVIGTQNLSTAFQFKNQLGLGFRTQKYDFFFSASHLSNASIKQPNDGLNIIAAGVTFKF